MRLLAISVLLPVLCQATAAGAQDTSQAPATAEAVSRPVDETPPNERRSGFTAGLAAGLVSGRAVGYPNEVVKLDDPEFRESTGFGVGGGLALWFGGALRDWFVFGLGASLEQVAGHGRTAQGYGFLFRVEAYPAYTLGGPWRDVSVFGDFGAGQTIIVNSEDTGKVLADGGSMSVVGLGAAYEPWRFGQLAAGPFVAYEHRSSLSLRSHTGWAGLRLAFYGGP